MTDPQTFYTRTIPDQFNAALDAQAGRGDDGRELAEGMRAVTATIRVDVTGEGGASFFLNIDGGRMQSGEAAAQPPFLTMLQDRASFDALVAAVGASAMALLGGLSGLTGGMHLTQGRVENLSGIGGTVGLTIEGEGGFQIVSHFGTDPLPTEPAATIRIAADVYGKLRSGELSAPSAFMEGKINIDGDMQLAMQLALSAVAPD
jgi:hypothetical protein